jgi:hypothetical protein
MKRWMLVLAFVASASICLDAAIAFVTSTNDKCGGATGCTTSPGVDTTGANFIVMNLAGVSPGTPSDNKSNSPTCLTAQIKGGVTNRLCYFPNPTVGSGHTFTLGGTVTSLVVAAFSGVKTSSPFDQENGDNVCSANCATFSITPSEDNELVVAGLTHETVGSASIDASMTILDQIPLSGGVNYGGALAYIVQTSAGAISPTWTIASADAATIASFKSSGASAPSSVPALVNAPVRGGGIRLVSAVSFHDGHWFR